MVCPDCRSGVTLIERLHQPQQLAKFLSGRFAWLADYPRAYEDAGETWYESIDPYRDLPARAGLELPFVHGQMPVGMLAYDLPQS
jgi:hypothetical protein